VFGLFSNGEKQIGWIPENDETIFKNVERMIEHKTFHATLHSASSKRLTETFQRVDICIFCSL
jgi:hypothetical protein